MEFKIFADKVNAKFEELSKQEFLYKVNVPSDDVWNIYINSYSGVEAQIFRERPKHDCNTCKNFIKRLGNVVAITDKGLDSIWNVAGLEGQYKEVAEKLHSKVIQAGISGVFYTTESLAGKEYNIEATTAGEIKWEHFYANIASKYVKQDMATVASELEATVSVFKRALEEISISTLETTLDLCSTIYKGEEFASTISKFKEAKSLYNDLELAGKKLFIWKEFNKYPARIRNTAIGSLLVDIEKGVELEIAVKSYEVKVAPQNYKRTSAVITPNMIKDAMKTINELGIEESLQRRFAVIEDVSINDVLYADRSSKPKMKNTTSIEDILMTSVDTKVDLTKVVDISIEEFLGKVLLKADTVEICPENTHINNMCSIIAPVIETAPNILKWNNNFSWAYKGGFTDAIKENVKSAGGLVEGDLRFSIQWNDGVTNENDLDAHCITPVSHIYYGSKSGRCSGNLDVDIITPNGQIAVENIIYPSKENMPKGSYQFKVVNFSDRGGSNFKAQIEIEGTIYNYEVKGRIAKDYNIATVTYNGSNFEIKHHIPCSESKRVIDGISTKEFNKVSAIMLSPNYWGENKVGNKHYMFLVEGCKNEDTIRGLYNEFLSEDLMKHRKVFDTLGSKLLCQSGESQLSGFGFSSTLRNELLTRVVSGNITKLYNIKF